MDMEIKVSGRDADAVDRLLKLILVGELNEYPGVMEVYTHYPKVEQDEDGKFYDSFGLQVDPEEMRKATEGGKFRRIHWEESSE